VYKHAELGYLTSSKYVLGWATKVDKHAVLGWVTVTDKPDALG